MASLIVFDLMGVLFPEPHIVRHLLYPLLPEPKDYTLVKEQYALYTEGKIAHDLFWKRILKIPHFEIEKQFLASFSLDKNAMEVIHYLRKKYQLAILSDLPKEWGNYLIKKFRFPTIFSPILISGIIGITKKQEKIWDVLQQATQLPFSSMVMIDDRKTILGKAKQKGVEVVWFQREPDPTEFLPDKTITSLLALKEWY